MSAVTGLERQIDVVLRAVEGDEDAIRSVLRVQRDGHRFDPRVREVVLRLQPDAGPLLDTLSITAPEPPPRPPYMDRSSEVAVAIASVRWAAGQYSDDSVAAGVACMIARQNGWILPPRVAYLAVRRLRQRRGAA